MTTNADNPDVVVDKTLQARWKRFYGKKSNKFAFWGGILLIVVIFGPPTYRYFFGKDADAKVAATDQAKPADQPATLTEAEVEDRINKALAKLDSTNNAKKMAAGPTQAQPGLVMVPDSFATDYSIRWPGDVWEYGVVYQVRK